jgi:hypothetical protein
MPSTSQAQLGLQRRSLRPDNNDDGFLGKQSPGEEPKSHGVESIAPSANTDVPNPLIGGSTNTTIGGTTAWAKRHTGRVLPIGEGTNKTVLFSEPSQPINYQGIGA